MADLVEIPHTGDMIDMGTIPKTMTDMFNIGKSSDIISKLKHQVSKVTMKDVVTEWWDDKSPSISKQQDCVDVINGKLDTETKDDINLSVKLAACGYALPYYWKYISTHLHMKNLIFSESMRYRLDDTREEGMENMNNILLGKVNDIELPVRKQMVGFYIRTPITIATKTGKRIFKIPEWKKRNQLLKYHIFGNVNAYVMKRRTTHDKFECFVIFRGTSNEFNAIPQYGCSYNHTPLYRLPQFDPIERKFYPKGNIKVPLFYYYYCFLVMDILPHIRQTLSWLGGYTKECEKITVVGHSMGGGIVNTFMYMTYHSDRDLWNKMRFRCVASPYSCNYAAVKKMEHYIVESMQTNKFIEILNRDDFVNIQFMLGGKTGFDVALKEGIESLSGFLIADLLTNIPKHLRKKNSAIVSRALRSIQLDPDAALAAFSRGAIGSQIIRIPTDKRAAFRVGQLKPDISNWGTSESKSIYNNTLKLIFCDRRVNWETEYMGKAHVKYQNIDLQMFWVPLREYENSLYNYYHRYGLKKNNKLRVIPLFSTEDLETAKSLVADYKPHIFDLSFYIQDSNTLLASSREIDSDRKKALKKAIQKRKK